MTHRSFVFLFVCLLCSHSMYSQIITTVAGSYGNDVYSGDGMAATAAGMRWPSSVALDKTGNIYIGTGDKVVRKVNAAGIISTFAGTGVYAGHLGNGGPATNAELADPEAVATDKAGNVYIGDHSGALRKVNTAGTISTYAGTGTVGHSGDGGQATAAAIGEIWGLATDVAGNIYMSDVGFHIIRKINTAGIISTIAGTPGSVSYTGDGGAATSATLHAPTGLATDNAGNVYFADTYNNVVRKISTTGIITTIAGNSLGIPGYAGDGGAATLAKLYSPVGVQVDRFGNLFISEQGNNVIRKVDKAGIIITYSGDGTMGYAGDNGPATAALLNFNAGIALDISDRLYIADYSNLVIRRIDTIAGYTLGTHLALKQQPDLVLFPNPSSGRLELNSHDDIESVFLMSITGQLLQTYERKHLRSSSATIDICNVPPGNYIVQINATGGIYKKALIVR